MIIPTPDPNKPKTIGEVALEALLDGCNNVETLAAVMAEHPNANTTINTVSWYRNKYRNEGHDIPTARELRQADKKRKEKLKKS